MRCYLTDSITVLSLCSESCGTWPVLRSPSLTEWKREHFNLSPPDMLYYQGTRLLLKISKSSTAWRQVWGGAFFFFFLNSPIYENFNHYKTFKKYKLTPKSQHDILTVINCCSLCQGSAHQQLAVAGIGHASCHCSTTSLQTLPSFQLARRISSIAPKHTAHIFSYLVEGGLSVHFLSICKR